MSKKKRTIRTSLWNRFIVAGSLGMSLAWYGWVTSDNVSGPVQSPNVVCSQHITIDESRKNPLFRQKYLDWICDGTPYKAVYDPDHTKHAEYCRWLDRQDGASSLAQSVEEAACVVASKSFMYGKKQYPPIFVFPRFWQYGFELSNGMATRKRDIETLDVLCGKAVYGIQSDDDCKAVLIGHEGWHSQDVHDGMGLSEEKIRRYKRISRGGFDCLVELRAYMHQLETYHGKMNTYLDLLAYKMASDMAVTCAAIRVGDPEYQRLLNHSGRKALLELPRYAYGSGK